MTQGVVNMYSEHEIANPPPPPPTLTFVHVECECSNSNTNHTLRVIEKLYGFRVEGKVPEMLVVEEVYRVRVEFERESLQERYVVCQYLLIREVQFQDNDGVYVVVGQEVIYRGGIITGSDSI